MTSTPAATGNAMTSTPAATGNAMTSTPAATGNAMTSTPAATGNAMTSAPGATTTAPSMTTVAAQLTPNNNVSPLATSFNRSGCGSEKLCAAEPSTCDPSATGSCFFLGARRSGGQNFELELSGESSGYVAAVLSPDTSLGGNDTTYVCANNNGNVKFFGANLNNGQLTETTVNANNVKGSINGNIIRCTFDATVSTTQQRASTVTLGILTGSFDSTSGAVGTPSTQLRSNPVDLGNPNATVTNANSPDTTTATITTASHAITLQQSLTQALLITVSVLCLAVL
nr:putative ferric-chelate reductase 1 [Labrus bergylta]